MIEGVHPLKHTGLRCPLCRGSVGGIFQIFVSTVSETVPVPTTVPPSPSAPEEPWTVNVDCLSNFPWRIHVWYIHLSYGLFLMVNVGKYTIHGSLQYWALVDKKWEVCIGVCFGGLLMFKLNPLTSFKNILFDVPYTTTQSWMEVLHKGYSYSWDSTTRPPQKGWGGLPLDENCIYFDCWYPAQQKSFNPDGMLAWIQRNINLHFPDRNIIYQEHHSIFFTRRIFGKRNPHQIKLDMFFWGVPQSLGLPSPRRKTLWTKNVLKRNTLKAMGFCF